jgi:hypothetical protein
MAQTHVHRGTYQSIPDDASPGLLFLRAILPALDSLGPFKGTPELATYLAPNATFIINNGAPVEASQVLGMLEMRASKLTSFEHVVQSAWDVDNGNGSRTVMYESASVTVFAEDKEGVQVRIREFNIIELAASSDGKGIHGLHAVQLRAYLDGSPVTERATAMMAVAKQ